MEWEEPPFDGVTKWSGEWVWETRFLKKSEKVVNLEQEEWYLTTECIFFPHISYTPVSIENGLFIQEDGDKDQKGENEKREGKG